MKIPIVLGIIKLWNLNVLKLQTEAILPYDQNLELFCSFLQQLESESNGKTFSKEGKRVPMSSTAVIFGQPGTNGQHAFYQMIHQGQLTIPSTFIFAREPANLGRFSATKKQIMLEQHRTLIANAIAQTEALMIGKDEEEVEKELQSKNVPMKSMQMLKFAKVFDFFIVVEYFVLRTISIFLPKGSIEDCRQDCQPGKKKNPGDNWTGYG